MEGCEHEAEKRYMENHFNKKHPVRKYEWNLCGADSRQKSIATMFKTKRSDVSDNNSSQPLSSSQSNVAQLPVDQDSNYCDKSDIIVVF